jgi:hypothetical protein
MSQAHACRGAASWAATACAAPGIRRCDARPRAWVTCCCRAAGVLGSFSPVRNQESSSFHNLVPLSAGLSEQSAAGLSSACHAGRGARRSRRWTSSASSTSVSIGTPGTPIITTTKAAPHVSTVVAVLIVDDVTARLPERLARPDDTLGFALQLEPDLAFEHVTEYRSRVPMRWRSRVTWWELNKYCHDAGVCWNDGGRWSRSTVNGVDIVVTSEPLGADSSWLSSDIVAGPPQVRMKHYRPACVGRPELVQIANTVISSARSVGGW